MRGQTREVKSITSYEQRIKNSLSALIVFFLIIVVDFFSKLFVIRAGIPYRINSGGAFSLLQGRAWYWVPASIIFFAVSGYWVYLHQKSKLSALYNLGFAAVIGGSLGNFLDRWLRGGVVDFIRIWNLPVFNFADLAISLGVVLIIGLSLQHD